MIRFECYIKNTVEVIVPQLPNSISLGSQIM